MDKRVIFVLFVLMFLLSACNILTTTADSIEDLQWSRTDDTQELRSAPVLNCENVVSCHNRNLNPDKYMVEDGMEELYIWVRNYFPGKYLFYAVVYRPYSFTWDGLGFENLYGNWTAGVYGSKSWYEVPTETSTVVLGYSGESWAVIVNGISESSFEYKVIINYWDR